MVYWWNPLLIRETYNSGHLEVILIPFILGALLFSLRQKYLAASGALALAVGVKLWPIILLPALLRPILQDRRRLVWPLAVFSALSLLMALPFWFGGLDSTSGLWVYLTQWQMNESFFLLLLWASQVLLPLFAAESARAFLAARLLALSLFGFWGFALLRKPVGNPQDFISRFLWLAAGLFMLSPAQFPWYFLWMLPFLAVTPRFPLLLLSALLPIYYLRFFFEARGATVLFDHYLVWLQFAPVWLMLLRAYRRKM